MVKVNQVINQSAEMENFYLNLHVVSNLKHTIIRNNGLKFTRFLTFFFFFFWAVIDR